MTKKITFSGICVCGWPSVGCSRPRIWSSPWQNAGLCCLASRSTARHDAATAAVDGCVRRAVRHLRLHTEGPDRDQGRGAGDRRELISSPLLKTALIALITRWLYTKGSTNTTCRLWPLAQRTERSGTSLGTRKTALQDRSRRRQSHRLQRAGNVRPQPSTARTAAGSRSSCNRAILRSARHLEEGVLVSADGQVASVNRSFPVLKEELPIDCLVAVFSVRLHPGSKLLVNRFPVNALCHLMMVCRFFPIIDSRKPAGRPVAQDRWRRESRHRSGSRGGACTE
ncbi:hypothetical protein SAMN04489731_1293 [Amycolatopsis regifaucium]|nr:hypothetical protein SAMN04489731_1293 [Amycolatopsis regifaucium]